MILRLLSLGLALVAAASATLVPEMTFEEIAAKSEAIVHGVVTARHASWDSAHASIWTHYQIEVRQTFKGPAEATITVSEPGGEVEGERMEIVGAPRYEIGDEVTVFATTTPIGYRRTCGWGQGKFMVIDAPTPSGRAVRSALDGVELIRDAKAANIARRSVPAGALDGLDFEAFKLRIRDALAGDRR